MGQWMEMMSEPNVVYSGDTLTWTKSLNDYPAPTWTLTYTLVREGDSVTVTATPSGTDHLVLVTAETSATYRPGVYLWTSFVSDGTARYVTGTGEITVKPNPASGGYDTRSKARIALDNIEAYLIDPNNLAASSYSIGGRSLSRWPRSELLVEREKWLAEVRDENSTARMAAGLGNPRRIYVRFDRV